MTTTKKSLRAVGFALACLLWCTFSAMPCLAQVNFDYAAIDPTVKVHDMAGLIPDEEEPALEDQLQNFVSVFSLDAAVVTVNKNPGTPEELADDIYDYSGFGDDGLLLLIDMENRELWISTKGTAIDVFSDDDIQDVIDAGYDDVKNEDYTTACHAFVEAAAQKVYAYRTMQDANYSGEDTSYFPYVAEDYNSYRPAVKLTGMAAFVRALQDGFGNVFVWLLGIVAGLIFLWVGYSKHKPVKIETAAASYVTKPLVLQVNTDTRLSSHVTRVKIPKDDGNSSGGHSSGSTHISSSGCSHGGGGRGF